MGRRLLAYWGNTYPDVFQTHLRDIKEHGFTAVLHPVTELDMSLYKTNVLRLLQATRQAGLEAWVSPMSHGNLFGLGATSHFLADHGDEVRRRDVDDRAEPYACLHHRKFRRQTQDWLKFVADAGAQWVCWDEPNFTRCFCKDCRYTKSPMLDFLTEMTTKAHEYGLKNSVALLALPPEGYLDLPLPHVLASLSAVDEIATSLNLEYGSWETDRAQSYIGTWINLTVAAARQFQKQSAVWVQGWNVPSGKENLLRTAASIAHLRGIDNVAHWGYYGAIAQGYAASDDPAAVWEMAARVCDRFFSLPIAVVPDRSIS